MKLTWKNKSRDNNKKRTLGSLSIYPNLPFDNQDEPNTAQLKDNDGDGDDKELGAFDHESLASREPSDSKQLAESFQAQGNKLAEDGKYREALGKWEAALTLMPENAVLHEQKAQVLLEVADAWNALKAATSVPSYLRIGIAGATELEPSWAEAWITLGRAQLNFGEPDSAVQSFDRALTIKPDSKEVQDDRHTALHLVKRRKQLHSSGLSNTRNRFTVGNKSESS